LARPFLLRRTPFDARIRKGYSYAHETDVTRIKTDPEGEDIYQRIEPPYVPGEIVYGASDVLGGTSTQIDTGNPLSGSLSVRDDDSTGSVALTTTPHGLVIGDLVSVVWEDGRRDGMEVLGADQPIQLAGGMGEDLPAVSTAVTVTEQAAITIVEGNRGARRWRQYWKGALAMGGKDDTAAQLGNADIYNPDAWTIGPTILDSRDSASAFTLGEGVVLVAGSISKTSVERFIRGGWNVRTPLPDYSRFRTAALTLNDKGYVVGGSEPGTPLPTAIRDVLEYIADAWTNRSDIPEPAREEIAAMVMGGKGYACGGNSDIGTQITDVDEFTAPNTWVEKTPMPSPPRGDHAGASIDAKGFVFGGYYSVGGTYLSDNDQYDADADTWTGKTDIPGTARRQLAGFSLGAEAYICGGRTDFEGRVREVHSWNLTVWTTRASLPAPEREKHCCSTLLA